MNNNTPILKNRNNKENIVDYYVKELFWDIRDGISKNKIFGVSNLKTGEYSINFNRISKYGNRYISKKNRREYLLNLLCHFKWGGVDYIGHNDGVLNFHINSTGIRTTSIEIEFSNSRECNKFKPILATDVLNGSISMYNQHGNKIIIDFVKLGAVEPNTYHVSYYKRTAYIEKLFAYMLYGFVTSIRMPL